jgi:NADPH:quinone reductase-like Zn-dependent oxidoreductase
MKAIVCTRYGPPDVLHVAEVATPIPKDHEVLIRVHAAAVTTSDCLIRSGDVGLLLWLPFRAFVGFRRPRRPVLGMELSGAIEAVGKDVRRFKPGDQVVAFTGKRFGAYAEYVCLPESGRAMPADSLVVSKPSNVSHVEAAAVATRGGLALYFLQRGNLRSGQRVLIYGASGGVGTFAIQIANGFGADVTAVCSAANASWVKSLGADRVMDYATDTLTDGSPRYDLVFDAVGKRKTSALKEQCKRALTPGGTYVSVDDGTAKVPIEDVLSLTELIEAGKVRPVIDRSYRLDQIVEAHRYVDDGHKRGNVVVTIDQAILGTPAEEQK